MKNHYLISLFIVAGLILIGCQKDDPQPSNPITSRQLGNSINNQELMKASKVISTFINKASIQQELRSYSNSDWDSEIYVPFKQIFDDASKRTQNSFASEFRRSLQSSCSDCRLEDFNQIERELSEGYALYAPYLMDYENVSDPITISWLDKEDTTSLTPGFVSLGVTDNQEFDPEIIAVDDEYAINNPTVVIYPIYYEEYEEITEDLVAMDLPSTALPRDIDCRTLTEESILEMQMPQYKLTDQTVGWPHPNKLYLWTVVGEFNFDENGVLIPDADDDIFWNYKRVRRGNVGKWLNSDISFVRSNWKQHQTEMRMIVAYWKPLSASFEAKGSVEIDTDKNFQPDASASFKVTKGSARTLFSVGFDRCSTLASITSDEGFGKRNDYRVYKFNKLKFYLKPRIR